MMADLLLFAIPGTTFTGSLPTGTQHGRLPTNVVHELHAGVSRLRIGSVDREASGELLLGGEAESASVGLGRTGADVNVHGLMSMPASAWDASRMKFTVGANTWHFWVDDTGAMRVKNGAPLGDFDGFPVGGHQSVFVFAPGGTAGGNTYTTWDTLYTAFSATAGPKIVQVDTFGGPAVISGVLASYDLTDVTFMGRPYSGGTISVLTVAKPLSALPMCVGRGMILINTMATAAYTTTATGQRFMVDFLGGIGETGGAPLIEISAGHTFVLDLLGGVSASAPGAINIGLTSGVAAKLIVNSFAGAFSQSFAGTSGFSTSDGTGELLHTSRGLSIVFTDPTVFAGFTGVYSRSLQDNSLNSSYSNSLSGLVSVNVQDAIDEVAAGAGGSSKWTDGITYLRPNAFTRAIVIGDTAAPVGTELLRVKSTGGGFAARLEGTLEIADGVGYGGSAGDWNGSLIKWGTRYLWWDSAGRLRGKVGAPVSEADGFVIGAQSG